MCAAFHTMTSTLSSLRRLDFVLASPTPSQTHRTRGSSHLGILGGEHLSAPGDATFTELRVLAQPTPPCELSWTRICFSAGKSLGLAQRAAWRSLVRV